MVVAVWMVKRKRVDVDVVDDAVAMVVCFGCRGDCSCNLRVRLCGRGRNGPSGVEYFQKGSM